MDMSNQITKTQKISQLITEQVFQHGKTLAEAIDAVCGEGTYKSLVNDLYNELRK
jgi:hypothetical protein